MNYTQSTQPVLCWFTLYSRFIHHSYTVTSQFISERKSITQIALEIGVSREYLHRYYVKIAQQSTDFPKDYLRLGTKTFTNIGLTVFQEWVIYKLRDLVSAGLTKQQFLLTDSDGFLEFAPEIDDCLSRRKYLEEKDNKPQEQSAELIKHENY